MKKLNKEDKKILLENQKEFYEYNKMEPDVSNFRFRLWFHKLNRYAKKYNIDLIAVPNKEIDSYSYQIDFGRSNRYKPCFRAYAELWENPKRAMKRLHLSAPEGKKVDKAVMFIAVPRYNAGRIVRRNFYKETGPTTYCDYIVLKISEA